MITTKRPTKFFAMITYVVALICIVLGFFYPYGTVQGTDGMIAMQLPKVIDTLFGTTLNLGADFRFPTVSLELFGLGVTLNNVYAILIVAYAVVAILGLLALIPICVSNRYTQTAKIWANIIEILALVVLSLYVFSDIARLAGIMGSDTEFTNWTPYIAFGGVGIVYMIQNIATKGSVGLLKSLLFVLASLSMYALLGLQGLAGQFPDLFTNLNNSLGSVSELFAIGGKSETGLDLGYRLFAGTLFGSAGIFETTYSPLGVGALTAAYLGLATCLLVTINFFLDMFGIAKKTNKGMLICNLVRYGLLLVVGVTLAILVVVVDGGKIGLMLYVILIATLIAALINVFRFIKSVKSGRKVKTKTADTYSEPSYDLYGDNLYEQLEGDTQPAAQPAPVAAQPVQEYQAPAAVETPAPAYIPPLAPVVQPRPTQVQTTEYQQVYNISSVYNGPTDNFIKKLSNDEKIEFAKVFLERRYGPLSVIPSYNFGGDNKKFFSAIFIYISRVREYLSDGLMNKIYEELNLLRQ